MLQKYFIIGNHNVDIYRKNGGIVSVINTLNKNQTKMTNKQQMFLLKRTVFSNNINTFVYSKIVKEM